MLVILTVVAWLATLTPATAAPAPGGDDPVRIGIGIGGQLINLLSDDHDDDDDDHGHHDDDDDDDDDGLLGDDGLLEVVLEVVEEVLEALFGDDDDSVGARPVMFSPADDNFEELLDFLDDVVDSDPVDALADVIESLEDTVETVNISVLAVVCTVSRLLVPPTGMPMPAPCI